MAGKLILTHSKVRELQRTLYQQAKTKPKWRAWSLYAELCRKEFIEEAMSRVLKNKGGSGIDGYTVETMEADWDKFLEMLQQELKEKSFKASAVRSVSIPKPTGGTRELGIPTVKDRVVQMLLVLLLEPIFEADFHDESYGYRPRKKPADAIESIKKALYFGKTSVIEADLSQYFDTIDHKRLIKLLKGRVSDGAILALVSQFLSVSIVKERGDGKHQVIPNTQKGVPQGGVISPLLANLYLDKLDKSVNALDPSRVKMVRYADDFVIMVKDGLEEVILERVKIWLERAGLTLNGTKTKVSYVAEGDKIEFLGFELSAKTGSFTGNRYIHCQPSQKSQRRYREKIKAEVNHWTTWRDTELLIRKMNRITRGWGNYFHHGNSTKVFNNQNWWLQNKLRKWLAKKHKLDGRSMFKAFPIELLESEMGLYCLPYTVKYETG